MPMTRRRLVSTCVAAFAIVGVACNALVGNKEATPAPPDEDGACGAACMEAGVITETSVPSDAGADVVIPYDGPTPIVHIEIFGDRPAAYGVLGDPDASYPNVYEWLPYQRRGTDLDDAGSP